MKIKSNIDTPILTTGAYIVDNIMYLTRSDAVDAYMNSKTKKPIRFWFYDEIFDGANFKQEPTKSVACLYKERAQQLRDKYNYLILAFSGGYDSTEILFTYATNNIPLDEIQIYNYEKLTEKLKGYDDDFINSFYEYDKSVKPILKTFLKYQPNVKIVVKDVSDDLLQDVINDKFMLLNVENRSISPFIIPPTARTYPMVMAKENNKNNRHNVGLISGQEKPKLFLDNYGRVWTYFLDVSSNSSRFINSGFVSPSYTPEWFYWSPDCVEIPIKQTHLIINKMRHDKKWTKQLMFAKKNKNFMLDQNMLVPIIYEHFHHVPFHGKKLKDTSSELYLLSHHHGLRDKIIDPVKERLMFLRNTYKSITMDLLSQPIKSKMYYVGSITETLDPNTILPKTFSSL